MTWRIVIGPDGRAEYDAIVDYYDQVAPEQVSRFLEEVDKVVASLADNPYLSMDRGQGVRKRAMAVFPYHIWYTLDEAKGEIQVLAVLHFRRGPQVIRSRPL